MAGDKTGDGRRHWPIVVALAIYGALSFAGYWNAWVHGPAGHALSPDGDQATSMWYLTWLPFAILHGHNPFFSNYGNFPYGVNTLVNAQPWPIMYLVSPITLLAGPVVSFNLVGTLSPFASAAAAFFLVRRFVSWQPAAFLGGLVYGFSPFVVGQGVGHVFMAFAALPPLILLLVHDLVVDQRGRPVVKGIVLGVLVVLQFFTSAEVLLTTAMIALAGLIVVGVMGRAQLRQRFEFAATGFGVGAVLAGVLLAYPIWAQFGGPAHVVGPVQQAPNVYRADLLGTVVPDSLQRFSPHSLAVVADKFAGNGSENGSYLGLPLVVLTVVAAVVLWRRRVVAVAAVLAALAWLLSLGSHLTVHNHVTGVLLPEGILDKLPVVKNLIPARFSMYVALFVGIILACAIEELHKAKVWKSARAAMVAPMVLGLGVLVPMVPAWPYAMVPVGTPAYFTSGAAKAIPTGSVAVIYPFPDATFAQPQLWQASTFLRFRMPGGRFNVPQPVTNASGPSRPSLIDAVFSELYAGVPVSHDLFLRRAVQRELRAWDVHTVVAVPTGANPAAALSTIQFLLGGAPAHRAVDVWVWYHWR